MMISWLVVITIGLPWAGALIVWGIGDRRARGQHFLACIFAAGAGLASLLMLPHASADMALEIHIGGVFGDFTLVADGLGVYLSIVASLVGSLAVLFSTDYMRGEAQLGRYYSLVLLFIGAMSGLVLAGGMLLMFVFWEITAFCSYALISFHNDDPKAVAGGIKALIMTQFGGVGLLAGALISYAHFGDYQIQTFLSQAGSLPSSLLTLIAFGFLMAAAAKSAQVPFHTWLPDAMEAPTPVTALIHAATMVNAGVYLLARFFPAFAAVPGWRLAVVAVGALSAVLAAAMALVADDLKRALAYSTISQLGYMVYSVGTGALFASQFHLLSHSLFKALLFLAAGAVIHSAGTRDMRLMGGLKRDMPFVRTAFVIGGFGLAGLPLANGFFSKELVLEGGLVNGPLWAYLAMLCGAGITALYTLRMTAMVFYGERRNQGKVHDAPPAMRASLAVLSLGTASSWLLAGPFSAMLHASLPFHMLEEVSTRDLVTEIIGAPATWLALLVIFLGFGSWMLRPRLSVLTQRLEALAGLLRGGLGFEGLNRAVISLTSGSASSLARTQTGILSWNIFGLAGGLVIVLLVLLLGV